MKTVLLLFALIITSGLYAQEGDPLEKLKSQKVAFITEKIGLSPTAAQKFWPVYNEFSEKKDSINQLKSSQRKEMKKQWATLTSKQKEAALDFQMEQRMQETKLEQQYHEKFKKFLSIDQLLKLYEAEHEFKMRLIRQLRQKDSSYQHSNGQKLISRGKDESSPVNIEEQQSIN
jgi:hypothetical protein